MMEKKNSNVWYILGGVIIVLLIVLIVLNLSNDSSANENNNTPKCEGVYMEYQGNCCLDNNYNNICDEIESKQPKNNGVVLNVACSAFQPCDFESWDYLGDGELCHQSCENGVCVLRDCKIGGCGRGTGVTCRYPSTCDGYSNECVVVG